MPEPLFENMYDTGQAYWPDPSLYYPLGTVPQRIRAKSESEVYGPRVFTESEVAVVGEPEKIEERQPYNEIIFSSLLLLLFVMYSVIVYAFRNYIPLVFRTAGTKRIEQNAGEQSLIFKNLVGWLNVMGYVAVTALAMKLCIVLRSAGYLPESDLFFMQERYLSLVCAGGVAAVLFYRFAAHRIIALISRDAAGVGEIKAFDRSIFALYVIILTPLVMALGILPDEPADTAVVTVLIPVALCLGYYIYRNYRFFMVGKFSILQWFSYLCAVEILPVSYFVLSVLRGM